MSDLSGQLTALIESYNAHMSAWADLDLGTKASIEHEDQMDVITSKIIDIVPQVINRLQTYAIDIDDAEKALGWKGINLEKGQGIATGIELLYAKLTTPPPSADDALAGRREG